MNNTTIQKRAHEATIYGQLYRVEVGDLVHPGEWAGPIRLQGSEWDKAEFYVPSYTYKNTVRAVNIKVTGRTFQRRPFSNCNWIKVQIEFVGDGEPSEFVSGWWAPTNPAWGW
jgi:hypothetical protein